MCFYCATVAYLTHHWCMTAFCDILFVFCPDCGAEYCDDCVRVCAYPSCLSASVFLELLVWTSPKFKTLLVVASSSSSGDARRNFGLWISSCLHIIAKNRRHDKRTSNWHTRIKHMTRSRVWYYRERKCADTIGTVPVPLAGHFQC